MLSGARFTATTNRQGTMIWVPSSGFPIFHKFQTLEFGFPDLETRNSRIPDLENNISRVWNCLFQIRNHGKYTIPGLENQFPDLENRIPESGIYGKWKIRSMVPKSSFLDGL